MSGARILVVEDEAVIAIDLTERLKRLGYTVVGVLDKGRDAIQRAGEFTPDLVLMDIQLKDRVDGIEAANAVAKQYKLPVVFLTAYSDDATLERAKFSLPYGYLLKPCEDRELRVTIEMALFHHQASQKIKRMERWLASTMNSLGDAVIATDVDGCISFMNQVAEQLTGYAPETVLGKPFEEVVTLVSQKSRQPLASPVQRALSEGLTVESEEGALLLTHGGRALCIDSTAAPIRNEKGSITGMVMVFRDISPRVLAEQERELADERLRQTQKMEMVGRMAGGIAHDFNNLMTVILGQCELLLARHPEERDRERTKLLAMQQAGQRAASLTRQLLASARKQILHPEYIQLNRLVGEMSDLIRRMLEPGVDVLVMTTPELTGVRIDPSQFGQVLLNLSMNARDAMPEGGQLTVRTGRAKILSGNVGPRKEWTPGDYVTLTVADTGTGMDEHVKAHLFEPFFTSKGLGEGKGLGLSMVQGIVLQSNGQIEVQTEAGKGSTFTIFLPWLEDDTKNVPTVRKETHGLLIGKRMLLVEDSRDILLVYEEIFKEMGCEVTGAVSGREALEKFNAMKPSPDIVLTDVVMPDGGGFELAEKLRAIQPELKILFHSGYDRDAISGIRPRMDRNTDFIEKPASPYELYNRINKLLSGS